MKPIPKKIVEETWQKLGQISFPEVPKLVDELKNKQPLLLAYLLAVDHDILNEDERELLLYLGINIWKMMSKGDKPLKEVTEKSLKENEKNNESMVKYIADEPDFDKTVINIAENYNQKEILMYVIEALMENEPDEDGTYCDIRDEYIGAMFMSLKTVIDCLDQ